MSLTQRGLLLAALAIAFVVLTAAVAGGNLDGADAWVATQFEHAYRPALLIPAQAVALLGGVEVTFGLAAILFAFLWQAGYRIQSFAALALPLATGVEELYKTIVFHPAPSGRISHPDGPSITDLFINGHGVGNSYPSGHMVRALVVYGLAAFIVYRLAESERRGALAVAAAVVIAVAVAFDRLYLGVHWVSDVIGALLLGGVFLLAAMFWLDLSPRLFHRPEA
jgi:undecaprenyl-diphosphatase